MSTVPVQGPGASPIEVNPEGVPSAKDGLKYVKIKRFSEYPAVVRVIALIFSLIPGINTLIFGSFAVISYLNSKQEQADEEFKKKNAVELPILVFLAIPGIGNILSLGAFLSGVFCKTKAKSPVDN